MLAQKPALICESNSSAPYQWLEGLDEKRLSPQPSALITMKAVRHAVLEWKPRAEDTVVLLHKLIRAPKSGKLHLPFLEFTELEPPEDVLRFLQEEGAHPGTHLDDRKPNLFGMVGGLFYSNRQPDHVDFHR